MYYAVMISRMGNEPDDIWDNRLSPLVMDKATAERWCKYITTHYNKDVFFYGAPYVAEAEEQDELGWLPLTDVRTGVDLNEAL